MSVKDNGRPGQPRRQSANNLITPRNFTTSQVVKVNDRTVGEVQFRTRRFVKHISLARHRFQKYDAVAYSVVALDRAEELGALWAQFHDDDTGNVFHISIAKIRRFGINVPGDDPQLAMPLRFWHRGPAPTNAPEPLPFQLELWGGA